MTSYTCTAKYITQFLLSFLVCCNLFSIAAAAVFATLIVTSSRLSIKGCLDVIILYS